MRRKMGDGMEMVLIVVMLFYLGLGMLMFSPFILLHMLLEAIFKKPSPPPPPLVKARPPRKPRRKTARQLELKLNYWNSD